MLLQPNIIERRLIRSRKLPWLMPDVMLAMLQAQVVIGAMELGVFDQFKNGPLNINVLAVRIGVDPDGMAVLVRALVALGYLAEENGAYRLTDSARRSLPDQDRQLIGTWFAEYMHRCAQTPPRRYETPRRTDSSAGR